mgnify:CR=1 FL=1
MPCYMALPGGGAICTTAPTGVKQPVSPRIGQSPGNSDEKKIPPEAVIWVTLMSAPPPPEGAVLCGSLWPGKGGIFESIMRSPVSRGLCPGPNGHITAI